ncbi:MAG: inorganic phosphate transporter [Anaerolineae bacterium]|nr:inorganic phosphate transporter [Anaerolineae bacterium]
MFNALFDHTALPLFIATAVLYTFLNGFNDSANTVATMISSRAMSARQALVLSAIAHFIGPFMFGVAVAATIGQEVITHEAATLPVIWAALLSAIIWSLITWILSIPSSASHALIGGMAGAAILSRGIEGVIIGGLEKVLIALLISPILGLIGGYLLMKIVLFLARGASPKINHFFKQAQSVTAMALALSHGANDAQKAMGIIAMGLLATGYLPAFSVPSWVTATCAVAMSLGTLFGGWRIIKTLGGRFYKIRPVHSFNSQLASTIIILGAGLLGGPVSTSQVVSATILGSGAAERVNKVRWLVVKNILLAWGLTVPAAAGIAALCYWLLVRILA